MQPYDVLVAGEINPDLILSDPHLDIGFGQQETLVEGLSLTLGSSSVIFACGAARLGLKVAFVGVVGNDLFGRFMLDAMTVREIDVSPVIIDSASATGVSVILARGQDRAILTYLGSIAALRAEQVKDDLLRQARHLHIASTYLQTRLQPGLPDLFHRARSLGLTTSLDTNWDPSGRWDGLADLFPLVDVFLPNENEALAITRTGEAGTAIARLAGYGPTVAVKCGGKGAIARSGDTSATTEALPVTVVDTVGAGDTFDAGFVYGHIHGWPLEKSLRLASICGSLSTQSAGGTFSQPTLAEAMQYLDLI